MNTIIQNILRAKAKLDIHSAECYHYDFTKDYFSKVYTSIVESVPKLRISDIKTRDDLEALGMHYHKNDVFLIPIHLIDFFDPAEYVVCFLDKSSKQIKDIDLDNRAGYLAYGIPDHFRG